jgi:L-fuconolactonase
MFGSDWPVCLLAAEYGDVFELLGHALSGLGARERADILGETAARTYGL